MKNIIQDVIIVCFLVGILIIVLFYSQPTKKKSIPQQDSIFEQVISKIDSLSQYLHENNIPVKSDSKPMSKQGTLRTDSFNCKSILQEDSIYKQIILKIDSLNQSMKKNNAQQIIQVFKENKSVKIGEKAYFVISGQIGNLISIKDLTGKNIISSEYKIYSSGKKEEFYEIIPNNTIFALTTPIQAFSISSTDFIGTSEILLHLENKQESYCDSIKINFQEKEITITVDSINIINTKAGQYEITYEITFSSPIIHELYMDVILNIETNSKTEQINHHIYIPTEATKFKKSFTFNSGRQLYHFGVSDVTLVNIIGTNNKYIKYTFLEKKITPAEEIFVLVEK